MFLPKTIFTNSNSSFFVETEKSWAKHMQYSYYENNKLNEKYLNKMGILKNIYTRFLKEYDIRGKKVVILGAGRGYDIPMTELCQRFEKVYSYDIDIKSLKYSIAELTPEETNKVALHQVNLSLLSKKTIAQIKEGIDTLISKLNHYNFVRFKSQREKLNQNILSIAKPDYKSVIRKTFTLLTNNLNSYVSLPSFNDADLIITSKVIYLANITKVEELFFKDLKHLLPEYQQTFISNSFPKEYGSFATNIMNYAIRDLSSCLSKGGTLLLQEVDQNLTKTKALETIDIEFHLLAKDAIGDLEILLLRKQVPLSNFDN